MVVYALIWWALGLLGSWINLQNFRQRYEIVNSDIVFEAFMSLFGPVNIGVAIIVRVIYADDNPKGNWKITDWMNK